MTQALAAAAGPLTARCVGVGPATLLPSLRMVAASLLKQSATRLPHWRRSRGQRVRATMSPVRMRRRPESAQAGRRSRPACGRRGSARTKTAWLCRGATDAPGGGGGCGLLHVGGHAMGAAADTAEPGPNGDAGGAPPGRSVRFPLGRRAGRNLAAACLVLHTYSDPLTTLAWPTCGCRSSGMDAGPRFSWRRRRPPRRRLRPWRSKCGSSQAVRTSTTAASA